MTRLKAKFLPCFHNCIPQLCAAILVLGKSHSRARLTNQRYYQIHAIERHMAQPVILQFSDIITEKLLHNGRDCGPCSCRGISGSQIWTSNPPLTATPCAHSNTSLSARDIQNFCSSRRNKTGSLIMPPSWLVIRIYLHCPTLALTDHAALDIAQMQLNLAL